MKSIKSIDIPWNPKSTLKISHEIKSISTSQSQKSIRVPHQVLPTSSRSRKSLSCERTFRNEFQASELRRRLSELCRSVAEAGTGTMGWSAGRGRGSHGISWNLNGENMEKHRENRWKNWLTWLVVTGTWLLFMNLYVMLGSVSSSQLTNSYFSEG